MKSPSNIDRAAAIIADVRDTRRADDVIRAYFGRERTGSGQVRREVAALVFDYYRWRGILDSKRSLPTKIREARRLALNFSEDPGFVSSADLRAVVPGWVEETMPVTDEWLRSLQETPSLWLRFRNRGETIPSEFEDVLDRVHPSPGGGSFRYQGQRDLFRTESFQSGAFEIQDLSSQWVGAYCQPRPGETWWDVCAGEGGKFLDLADRMEGRGTVWVTDRSKRRLTKLRQRAARAEVFNYRWRQADLESEMPFKVSFHGVLIDAPCSGLGTWQRNPDARWSAKPGDIVELAELQRKIVERSVARVARGGRLIYAVCTLAGAETQEIADWFDATFGEFEPCPLAEEGPPTCPGFKNSSARRWLGGLPKGGNGMFVAAWRRK